MPLSPHAQSFFHLTDAPSQQAPCVGTACFVARNSAGIPSPPPTQSQLYCRGYCYTAISPTRPSSRPRIESHAPTPILLQRVTAHTGKSLADYRRNGGLDALARALAMPPAKVVDEVIAAQLRGRGGAGFPAGSKWLAVAQQKGPTKHVVANADEGDPGAYIDRILLEEDPFCLIEALIIAAWAVGAGRGYIYLRKEYPDAHDVLARALGEARAAGLLGESVLGRNFRFDIDLHVGQGSYICGEETALLNAVEGRRPEVRTRPPYPTESGLFGQPTLVTNVETLANVPWILLHGGAAYAHLGFGTSRGNKLVSLNSLFSRPGLYEVEFGVPVRHIVENIGGGLAQGSLHGVMIGGPLAGVIPPELLDTPFGYEELRAIGASVGHGGIIAFDEHTSIPQLVHHVFAFGAFESCGKCTPCRLGSRRIEQMFAQYLRSGTRIDATEWRTLLTALSQTSVCGLGSGLAEFANGLWRNYHDELAPCFK